MIHALEQIWTMTQYRKGKIIWEETKKNLIPLEGEKALVDTFYRNNGSTYFLDGNTFYIGLYYGSVAEATVLSNVPEWLGGFGYARQAVERSDSNVGWPIIQMDENNWRVVSKTVTITAAGGAIGPINGAFLCTTLDNTGVLIGAVSMSVARTIPAGDWTQFSIRAKQK